MKIIRNIITLIVLVFLFSACNIFEKGSTSNSAMVLNSITGNDIEGNSGSTTIFVDVVQQNDDGSYAITNDAAVAELEAVLLNPDVDPTNATFYQDIIVDQVDLEYTRVDNNNVAGTDVIYAFSQAIHFKIPIGETVDVPFVLVQHVSKLESPLVELWDGSQEVVLKMEVKCTIYGKDVAGNRVTPVTGTVSVWFGNFSD